MDPFMKGLKAYCTELSTLEKSICVDGTKLKIGKFKIVQTPSSDAANRLKKVLKEVISKESDSMAGIYDKIEKILKEIQIDLFNNGKAKGE